MARRKTKNERMLDTNREAVVGEICDFLHQKASRFEELGDSKQVVLLETLADIIWNEWGKSDV